MTLQIREVYDAFKEAGVSEETARSAAESLTGYEDKFHHLEREMDRRFGEMQQQMDQRFNEVDRRFNKTDLEISEIKGMLRLMKWMLGSTLALVVAVFLLLLRTVLFTPA